MTIKDPVLLRLAGMHSEARRISDFDEKTALEGKEPLTESHPRVINRQNSHLRQIWMIAGYLGLSGTKWPKQGNWPAALDSDGPNLQGNAP
jgi:hypothetical protein